MSTETENSDGWHKTACVLCSVNCGIEVKLDGRRITRVRGDKSHPGSLGYTCEKGLRVDHYQNGRHRITSPLRRRDDGSYEEIDWDTALHEVAIRLVDIRDTHGGDTIFYYGGGGQGNHLGGGYSSAIRRAVGSTFSSNALAQEKTGEFWVDGELFGHSSCHTTHDFEHAEVSVFWGKNPWHSHGFPRARVILKEIARDPNRTMIVIDPRRSETADMADIHLQVRPGGDGWLLAALLAVITSEGLVDESFITERTTGYDAVVEALTGIDVGDYADRAGVSEDDVRSVARLIAGADSVSILEDLGIQMAPHSTMNSYLEKLVTLLTGNFGKRGAVNLHTQFAPLFGGDDDRVTPVTGHRLVTGLVPCNVIPDEIVTDHPDRFRAMIVESGNPAHSLAGSERWREAFDALDFSVVIDVAMTETARLADIVLPAASQYEKWENTFFTLEFPDNVFHLRSPILEPLEGTLPEPEIHARLVEELGVLDSDALASLRSAAEQGRGEFADAFMTAMATDPTIGAYLPVVLYLTLGATLPDGAAATAAIWGLAQRCAMSYPESVARAGHADADALFDAIFEGETGVVFTRDEYEDTFGRIRHADGKIHLDIDALLTELISLTDEQPAGRDDEFPFILAAGERRSSTANTIMRDPEWRRKDKEGALRVHPEDADRVGLTDGEKALITTRSGSAIAVVELSETMRPGFVSLPNGLGLDYPGGDSDSVPTGVAPNELTSTEDRDWFAGTPHHKHVPAQLEPA